MSNHNTNLTNCEVAKLDLFKFAGYKYLFIIYIYIYAIKPKPNTKPFL
jgi:hypothetical protein